MKAEALATFSTTTFKKGREKKETSPALVKQEDDWNDNHYDSVIKEEEKMEDRNNDNDNGDITDEPQGEMEEEVEAASEITEKEYVCSFAFLTLEYPQLHLIYMLMSFPSWKMVVTWIKFMLIDTHPELLEALEEATRSRDQKINHATKRYRLERERIARTFEAMQIANLSELKSVEMDLFEGFYKQSFLSIRRKLSSRSRSAAKGTQATNGSSATKQQQSPTEALTSQI